MQTTGNSINTKNLGLSKDQKERKLKKTTGMVIKFVSEERRCTEIQ